MKCDAGTRTPPDESLLEAFLRTASRDPDAPAWYAGNAHESRECWTWRELEQQVAATSRYLRSLGTQPGDRVVNLERNRAEWAILDIACAAIGATHCPLDHRLSVAMIQHCIRALRPTCVFSPIPIEGIVAQSLNQAFHDALMLKPDHRDWSCAGSRGEDVACILFTSGTTGHPRGVMLTHRNLLANAAAKLDAMPQDSTDRRLNILPFAHAYARTCELTAWILSGGAMMCCHDVTSLPKLATQFRPTLFNAVPSVYDWIANSSPAREMDATRNRRSSLLGDLPSFLGGCMRRMASGGAPLPTHLRRRFEEIGLPIFQGYGLTESSPVVCSNRSARNGEPNVLRGVGPTVRGVEVRMDNEHRLWVRGDGVMKGYWDDPAATRARLRDGWLDTGDIANVTRIDGEPEVLEIEGRCDDVQVLSTGDKFSPATLEHCLIEHRLAHRCALFGHQRRTPILVVPSELGVPTWDAKELLDRARSVLRDAPEYALPTDVIIDPEPWTVANGCLHWKGHVLRSGVWSRWRSALSD